MGKCLLEQFHYIKEGIIVENIKKGETRMSHNEEIVNFILRHTPKLSGSMDYQELVSHIEKNYDSRNQELMNFFGNLLHDYAEKVRPVPARAKDLDPVFVSLAIGTDKDRKYLTSICAISKDEIAATDGHRVHRARIPNGNYTPGARFEVKRGKLVKIEYDGYDFPPLDQVTPRPDMCDHREIKVTPQDFVDAHLATGMPVYRIEIEGVRFVFNKQYVDDAMSWWDSMSISFNGSLDPVLFTCGNRSAVVMPMCDDWTKKKVDN